MVGKILVIVLLVLAGAGLGWWGGRKDLASKVQADTAAAHARARLADSSRAADSADYILFRQTADALQAGALAESARLRAVASGALARDRAKDSALSNARTAGDSLPVVVAQRDDARIAADTALARGDRLEQEKQEAIAAERENADSALARLRRSGTIREASLLSDIRQLRIELENAKGRGKLFGFLPMPTCILGYGGVVTPSVPVHAAHGVGAMCGIKIRL